jgi:hypothetical protein
MATMKELEAQLATLAERVAFLEHLSPDWRSARRTADTRAMRDRLRAASTLEHYATLPAGERDQWARLRSDEQLVELLRDAKPELRDEVLARLPWERKALVTFQLAPAPLLVRVHNPERYRTRPTKLTESQVETLTAAGVRVSKRERTSASDVVATLPGWRGEDRDVTLDAAAWQARVAVDEQLAQLVEVGHVAVTTLSDAAARKYATEVYLDACRAKRDLAGATTPNLPSL